MVDYHLEVIRGLAAAQTMTASHPTVQGILRAWRLRTEGNRAVEERPVPRSVVIGRGVQECWDAPDVPRERGPEDSVRLQAALIEWRAAGIASSGVICPERLISRRYHEASKAGALRTSVRVPGQPLATLTAKPADHWFRLEVNSFANRSEVLRVYELGALNPLHGALMNLVPRGLTMKQAVSACGRGVAPVAARYVMGRAWADGRPPRTYISAFSGVDFFAASMHDLYGSDWEHLGASEPHVRTRVTLVQAWEGHGLTLDRVALDASSPTAINRPHCDVYTTTPECSPHSGANHHKSVDSFVSSLETFRVSLRYLGVGRPKIVIVENVNEEPMVSTVSSIVGEYSSYKWEHFVVCPWEHFGAPHVRERSFWIGRLKRS